MSFHNKWKIDKDSKFTSGFTHNISREQTNLSKHHDYIEGDRFIANRNKIDSTFQQNYLLFHSNTCDTENPDLKSQENKIQDFLLNNSKNLLLGDANKILNFKSKQNTNKGFFPNLNTFRDYSQNFKVESKNKRVIPSIPERVLDAPQLLDDYYLNLLDWSSTNILSVCLGNSVYLWNGNSYETLQLFQNNDIITSVAFLDNGFCLAIGLPNGNIQLWDINKRSQIRNMTGHTDRVGCLSWNKNLLSSGSKDTNILNHDVRMKENVVQLLKGHTQEVCGLKWQPDGKYLASGSNDNSLCLWDITNKQFFINNYSYENHNSSSISIDIDNENMSLNQSQNQMNQNVNQTNLLFNLLTENSGHDFLNQNKNYRLNPAYSNLFNPIFAKIQQIAPKFKLNQHKSAVKALAWCPWQKNIIASGGGKTDKTIKFWNSDTGSMIKSVETNSQVCSLIWNPFDKEIVSSHGHPRNQISVWKYPEMNKITELVGHFERVLYMSLSPDSSTIVSGSCDETLRFWKVFQAVNQEKSNSNTNIYNFKSNLNSYNLIR